MGSIYKLKSFKKTIAVLNTAEQLSTAATGILGRFAANVTMHAPSGNSATVYVGDSSVTASTGFPLIAGSTLSIGDVMKLGTGKQYDLSEIYVYGAAGNLIHVVHEQEV